MKTTLRPLLVPALAAIALCACQPAARATPPDASPPASNTPEANARARELADTRAAAFRCGRDETIYLGEAR